MSYNRTGYLDSDPAVAARGAGSIVAELRDELQRRNLNPPYVHSGHYIQRGNPGVAIDALRDLAGCDRHLLNR